MSFSLIVDDFRVKYVEDDHAKHLIDVLKEHYTVTTDWKGENTVELLWTGTITRKRYTCPCRGTVKKHLLASNTDCGN